MYVLSLSRVNFNRIASPYYKMIKEGLQKFRNYPRSIKMCATQTQNKQDHVKTKQHLLWNIQRVNNTCVYFKSA